MTINILLVDDHEIVLEGLSSLINKLDFLSVAGIAKDGRCAVQKANELNPDLIIMDISMPNLNGIEATKQIRENCPDCKIIILSMHTAKGYVFKALSSGASGYLLKQGAFQELETAIHTVLQNQIYLSPAITGIVVEDYVKHANQNFSSTKLTSREKEILQLIAEGKMAKEIANELCISVKTVDVHRRNIMEKLELHTTAELIRYAIREGLTSDEF